MWLKFKIITLRVIKSFTINLTVINRALKQLFARIYKFVMAFKVAISVGVNIRVISLASTL